MQRFRRPFKTVPKRLRSSSLAVACLALAACASAPVQEMSDARQAIHVAEQTSIAPPAADTLQKARQLLLKAQSELEAGAYDNARQHALDARDQAIRAREQASPPLPANASGSL